MKRIVCILCLFLLILYSCVKDLEDYVKLEVIEYRGTVMDAKTKENISNAKVCLTDGEKIKQKVETNNVGQFSISIDLNDIVERSLDMTTSGDYTYSSNFYLEIQKLPDYAIKKQSLSNSFYQTNELKINYNDLAQRGIYNFDKEEGYILISEPIVPDSLMEESELPFFILNSKKYFVYPYDNAENVVFGYNLVKEFFVFVIGGESWGGGIELNTTTHDGAYNTQQIVNFFGDYNNGNGGYAAKICDDLVAFNQNDWFLPSREQLKAMYNERSFIENFEPVEYWSSYATGEFRSNVVDFSDGEVSNNGLWQVYHRCRCIREDVPINNYTIIVKNEHNEFVKDAIINIYDGGIEGILRKTTQTDDQGGFSFDMAENKNYTFIINGNGYPTLTLTFDEIRKNNFTIILAQSGKLEKWE